VVGITGIVPKRKLHTLSNAPTHLSKHWEKKMTDKKPVSELDEYKLYLPFYQRVETFYPGRLRVYDSGYECFQVDEDLTMDKLNEMIGEYDSALRELIKLRDILKEQGYE
jgi:hypothetical protein